MVKSFVICFNTLWYIQICFEFPQNSLFEIVIIDIILMKKHVPPTEFLILFINLSIDLHIF